MAVEVDEFVFYAFNLQGGQMIFIGRVRLGKFLEALFALLLLLVVFSGGA